MDLSPIATTPEGDGAPQQPPVTKEQVEAIIRQAVGFDADRNDEIEVLVATLLGSPFAVNDVPIPGTTWTQWLELAKNASLGLASIAALILGFFVVRRMKPVPVTPEVKHQPATADPQKLGELLVEAREHPQLVAQILATWLDETPETAATEDIRRSTRSAA